MALTQVAHGGLAFACSGELQQTSAMSDYQLINNMSNYITTAAVSNHTHGDLYIPLNNSSEYQTSVLSGVFQIGGAYLTTAAVSDHNHGGFSGTNISGTYNSNELKLSIAAPGGDVAPSRSICEIIPGEYLTRVSNISATKVSKRMIFNPFWLDGNGLAASTIRIYMSWVTNATGPIMTYGAGLYSRVNATSMALYDSTTAALSFESTQSAQYTGIRAWNITGMTKTLSEGPWVLGLFFYATATGNINASLYGASAYPAVIGHIYGGTSTEATNNSIHLFPYQGYYSATTDAIPSNVVYADILGGQSAAAFDFYALIKEI
jgi:hypothetical protein